MAEQAAERVTVLASPELLDEMRDTWSRPVQVKGQRDDRGEWSFVFRNVPEDYEPPQRIVIEAPQGARILVVEGASQEVGLEVGRRVRWAVERDEWPLVLALAPGLTLRWLEVG